MPYGIHLTDEQKAKIVQLAIQGIQYKYIAERFGISFRTVSKVICDARKKEMP